MMRTKRSTDKNNGNTISLIPPRFGRDLTYPTTGRGMGKRLSPTSPETAVENSPSPAEDSNDEEDKTDDTDSQMDERPYSKNLRGQFLETKSRTKCNCDQLNKCKHTHPFQFKSVFASSLEKRLRSDENTSLTPPSKKRRIENYRCNSDKRVSESEEQNFKNEQLVGTETKKEILRGDKQRVKKSIKSEKHGAWKEDILSRDHLSPRKCVKVEIYEYGIEKTERNDYNIKQQPAEDGFQVWGDSQDQNSLHLPDFDSREPFEEFPNIEEEIHQINWNFADDINWNFVDDINGDDFDSDLFSHFESSS